MFLHKTHSEQTVTEKKLTEQSREKVKEYIDNLISDLNNLKIDSEKQTQFKSLSDLTDIGERILETVVNSTPKPIKKDLHKNIIERLHLMIFNTKPE